MTEREQDLDGSQFPGEEVNGPSETEKMEGYSVETLLSELSAQSRLVSEGIPELINPQVFPNTSGEKLVRNTILAQNTRIQTFYTMLLSTNDQETQIQLARLITVFESERDNTIKKFIPALGYELPDQPDERILEELQQHKVDRNLMEQTQFAIETGSDKFFDQRSVHEKLEPFGNLEILQATAKERHNGIVFHQQKLQRNMGVPLSNGSNGGVKGK